MIVTWLVCVVLILILVPPVSQVAQDEFNCFDKPKPKCPDDGSGLVTLYVVLGLTALFIIHHVYTTPDDEKGIGCIERDGL